MLQKILNYKNGLTLIAIFSVAFLGYYAGDIAKEVKYCETLSDEEAIMYSESRETQEMAFWGGAGLALGCCSFGSSVIELSDLRKGKSRYK